MIPQGNRLSNIERFNGYQQDYDRYRPEAPAIVRDVLTGYLEAPPSLVVDLGCGTGLSTFIWAGHASRIIGIEPGDDMRSVAQAKLSVMDPAASCSISFIQGFSNQIDLPSGSADLVTCSQSFHWMEPESTLREAARVLRDGGVFAAYDCDWPPVSRREIEQKYHNLIDRAEEIIGRLVPAGEQAHKYDKSKHLANIIASGEFRYTREIVFHHYENCDAERYVGLMLSQGGVQTVLRLGADDLNGEITAFRALVEDYFQGQTRQIMLCYRMRLGIK